MRKKTSWRLSFSFFSVVFLGRRSILRIIPSHPWKNYHLFGWDTLVVSQNTYFGHFFGGKFLVFKTFFDTKVHPKSCFFILGVTNWEQKLCDFRETNFGTPNKKEPFHPNVQELCLHGALWAEDILQHNTQYSEYNTLAEVEWIWILVAWKRRCWIVTILALKRAFAFWKNYTMLSSGGFFPFTHEWRRCASRPFPPSFWPQTLGFKIPKESLLVGGFNPFEKY